MQSCDKLCLELIETERLMLRKLGVVVLCFTETLHFYSRFLCAPLHCFPYIPLSKPNRIIHCALPSGSWGSWCFNLRNCCRPLCRPPNAAYMTSQPCRPRSRQRCVQCGHFVFLKHVGLATMIGLVLNLVAQDHSRGACSVAILFSLTCLSRYNDRVSAEPCCPRSRQRCVHCGHFVFLKHVGPAIMIGLVLNLVA